MNRSYADYKQVLKLLKEVQKTGRHKGNLELPKKEVESFLQGWAKLPESKLSSLETLYAFGSKDHFKKALEKGIGKPPIERKARLRVRIETEKPQSSLEIFYSSAPSPFGECFLALAGEKICKLSFIERQKDSQVKEGKPGLPLDKASAIEELSRFWPRAKIYSKAKQAEAALIRSLVSEIFFPKAHASYQKLCLLVHGSSLQLKVWNALLDLPMGSVVAYSQLAHSIGKARAVRAVARAIAKNPISYLVPCHRVISKTGQAHAYRWGRERKLAILLREGLALQTR